MVIFLKACVIGCGHVGLPLAMVLAEKIKVVGVDVNQAYLGSIQAGKMPFVEEGMAELFSKVKGNLSLTTDVSAAAGCDVIIITLGTPLDNNMNPDMKHINTVLDGLMPLFRKGQMLVLRSTVSPGMTKYVKKRVEKETKLRVGRDFFLAYCPERIAEGIAIKELKSLPQLVGAFDAASASKAKSFVSLFAPHTIVSAPINVELAKIFCNVYRYINFAIANEFMLIADKFDADIYEIVRLVNEKYPRGGLKTPGLTAGPCLFKDHFFVSRYEPYSELGLVSWKINEGIPYFLVSKARKLVDFNEARVLVLGLAFKKDIDDVRDSLSFKLIKTLKEEGAEVTAYDPFVKGMENVFDPKASRRFDAIFIATGHSVFADKKASVLRLLKDGGVLVDIWNMYGTNKIVAVKRKGGRLE